MNFMSSFIFVHHRFELMRFHHKIKQTFLIAAGWAAKPSRSAGVAIRDHDSPGTASFVERKYDEYLEECESWSVYESEKFDCQSYRTASVEGKGLVSFQPANVHASHGSEGKLFETNSPGMVLKVSHWKRLCVEMAILRAIDGLGGFAPKVYMLDAENPGVPPQCRQRMIFMDEAGDRDWNDVLAGYNQVPIEHTYIRMSRILEALARLQKVGISHQDLFGLNVRISLLNPWYIKLIDFGRSVLISKQPEHKSFDILHLCTGLNPPFCSDEITPNQLVSNEYFMGLCLMTSRGELDFDFWVSFFLHLARKDYSLIAEFERMTTQELANQLAAVDETINLLSADNVPGVVQKLKSIVDNNRSDRVEQHLLVKLEQGLEELVSESFSISGDPESIIDSWQRAEDTLHAFHAIKLYGIKAITERLEEEMFEKVKSLLM